MKITKISKLDKDRRRKENKRPISLLNTDIKTLDKLPANLSPSKIICIKNTSWPSRVLIQDMKRWLNIRRYINVLHI